MFTLDEVFLNFSIKNEALLVQFEEEIIETTRKIPKQIQSESFMFH